MPDIALYKYIIIIIESVEADMAEHEIDKEDAHDRSKWRRNVNVMKRKSILSENGL